MKSQPGQFGFEISALNIPLANSATMSSLRGGTVGDSMIMEVNVYPAFHNNYYVKAKHVRVLTLGLMELA